MFFFASGILGSVSLTLFIDQFADSFLASLPDFYATFFFSSYYRAFSGRVFQSFSALLSPWRNSQIRIHTRTSGWPRVWHIRVLHIRLGLRCADTFQTLRNCLSLCKHFDYCLRHRNEENYPVLSNRRRSTRVKQLFRNPYAFLNLEHGPSRSMVHRCGVPAGDSPFVFQLSLWQSFREKRGTIVGLNCSGICQ